MRTPPGTRRYSELREQIAGDDSASVLRWRPSEVGAALKEIRDRRLYRAQYGTFEEYVKGRFAMSRPQAYRLIDGSDTAKCLPRETNPNERQIRPLTKLPKEQRAEVWAEVVAEGKPTAAKVEAA